MDMTEKKLIRDYTTNDYLRSYADYVGELLAGIDVNSVGIVVQYLLAAREKNKTIYFAGNGGSASTASHFAQDIAGIGRKVAGAVGFRAQSITESISALTAIGNDYDYDSVFALQLQHIFNPGDVLVVISASGNSSNIIKAVNLAKEKGGITIGLVGFDGGHLADICDCVVHIKTPKGEYGPVEDIHLILNHMMTSYITTVLQKEACYEK